MARKHSENNLIISSGGAGAVPSRRKPARRGNVSAAAEVAAVSAPAGQLGSSSFYEPSREEIEKLAYSYWLARGGRNGSPEEDWARAEAELRGRMAIGA